jgi:phenylacetate-CoA ligase
MLIRSDHPFLIAAQELAARPPLRWLKGAASAYVAYPIAEKLERRAVSPKLGDLRRFYLLPIEVQRRIANDRLAATLAFAQTRVPYYGELFERVGFDPQSVVKDPRFIGKLPYLTKEIIAEQGSRLLSMPIDAVRHYECKTGGSTGRSATVFYDQDAADHAAAVVLFARESIGKTKYRSEVHFACRFPGSSPVRWPSREDLKCMAMNRSNILFDRFDDAGLEQMWRELNRHRPHLAHAHPSTMYAIARHVERSYGDGKAFEVFESSGELLEPYMCDAITRILNCRVVDRYGLAEVGVVAYELGHCGLQVFTSECFAENGTDPKDGDTSELILTGLRNRLMPLIRYRTGDIAQVNETPKGTFLTGVTGRIHDVVQINGVSYPTHHIQDVLDHRVGGIEEFQIDKKSTPHVLRIVLSAGASREEVAQRIDLAWPKAFDIRFVGHGGLVRVGVRAKFRHVVDA